MQLITLITGPIEVNTYILLGNEDGKCVIIDPSDTRMVTDALEKNGVVPTHILLTHGHFDHILSVAELKKKYGAKVAIHSDEAAALTDGRASLAFMSGVRTEPCEPDILLHGGEHLLAAGFDIDVVHTPGHSKGSVCYILEKERVIFAGDTLFRLSVGRSDLAGGDPHELYDSIAYSLFTLKGDYEVYPGHMRKTSLQFERERNPFMVRWSPDTW